MEPALRWNPTTPIGTVQPSAGYDLSGSMTAQRGGSATSSIRPARGSIRLASVRAISGLTFSNNGTDVTNDTDVAAGIACADSHDCRMMMLGSSITKRLDASWAVGIQGGIWLIRRPDTGWWTCRSLPRPLCRHADELHAEAAHWQHHWDWWSDPLNAVVVVRPDNLERFRRSIGRTGAELH
jgi:hypothetical protein